VQSRERRLAERLASGEGPGVGLDYPKAPLRCADPTGLNLLVILVDALRAEAVDAETAPRLHAFARGPASRFERHFSGGNSSRMGAFSFFYGLPPAYFSAVEAAQRPAVLVDELQRQDYALGIFSAATLYRPVALDRTAFAHVTDLRMQSEPAGDPSWKRDRTLTREWFDWLDDREASRPFFGFLFYDTPNGRDLPPEEEFPRARVPENHPMPRAMSEYRTAVRYTDTLIGEVLDDLERRGLAENTVVMVSSDHGEEFNESGEGLDKHGSGYSDYQLHVPMAIAWPGRAPTVHTHRTSHYDVAPTLLGGVLGCANPPSDYAVGGDLYDGEGWPWIVAGSYYNYAVVEPDQVTVTFPNGRYEVRDRDYRLLEQPRFDAEVLEAVMRENTRFFEP
jgi:membrane-anchored protein YejM (alkaline phosphatase superfamily)